MALACGIPRWSASADGKRLALWKQRAIFVVERDGKLVKRLDASSEVLAVFLSPDGEAVVCELLRAREVGGTTNFSTELLLFDVESGIDRPVGEGFVGDGWSPDGSYFAFVARDGVTVYERRTGRCRALLRDVRAPACWAPDGRALYAIRKGAEEGRGRLVRVSMAGEVERLADTAECGWVRAGADGSVWVAAPERGSILKPEKLDKLGEELYHARLRRWDAKARRLVQISDEAIPWVEPSPDGKRILAMILRPGEGNDITAVLAPDGAIEKTLHADRSGHLEALPTWLDASTVVLCVRCADKVHVWMIDVATGKRTDWTAAYEALK